MKRVLSLILAAFAMLLCACTSEQATIAGAASDAKQITSNAAQVYADSHQMLSITADTSPHPSSSAQQPEKTTPVPSADWWEKSEGFSKFPRYTYGGDIAKGYENGAVTAKQGTEQYLLKNVEYKDYKAYVDELSQQGYKLYDPYGGFVEQTELELSAIYGSAVFEKENCRLYIEYKIYTSNLRMEVLIDQKTS